MFTLDYIGLQRLSANQSEMYWHISLSVEQSETITFNAQPIMITGVQLFKSSSHWIKHNELNTQIIKAIRHSDRGHCYQTQMIS